MKLPDRWMDYTNMGKCVAGTRFLPFKVPLKEGFNPALTWKNSFTPSQLLDIEPRIKLVIDLTFTKKYYDPRVFTNNQVRHKKIFCPGGKMGLPPTDVIHKFFNAVDEFLRYTQEDDGLIGVHCTHGLNRTGYLICKYMISRMAIPPQQAILLFEEARGYKIERPVYTNDLLADSPSEISKATTTKMRYNSTPSRSFDCRRDNSSQTKPINRQNNDERYKSSKKKRQWDDSSATKHSAKPRQPSQNLESNWRTNRTKNNFQSTNTNFIKTREYWSSNSLYKTYNFKNKRVDASENLNMNWRSNSFDNNFQNANHRSPMNRQTDWICGDSLVSDVQGTPQKNVQGTPHKNVQMVDYSNKHHRRNLEHPYYQNKNNLGPDYYTTGYVQETRSNFRFEGLKKHCSSVSENFSKCKIQPHRLRKNVQIHNRSQNERIVNKLCTTSDAHKRHQPQSQTRRPNKSIINSSEKTKQNFHISRKINSNDSSSEISTQIKDSAAKNKSKSRSLKKQQQCLPHCRTKKL